MSHHFMLDAPTSYCTSGKALEDRILSQVEEHAVIGLDALVLLMPEYSWSQIFHAVDRLARRRGITLRRHRSEYTLFSRNYAA